MDEFKSRVDRRELREIVRKGRMIYERLVKEENLERKHLGSYIVINVDTGEYILGKTELEAYDAADMKFPDARQFHAQVGVPTYV